MAYHEQAAVPGLHHRQPLRATVVVQVVGRFIEYEKVGLAQPGANQRHAHGLPAAQGMDRALQVQVAQAMAVQLGAQALGRIPALADGVEVSGLHAAECDPFERCDQGPHLGQIGHGLAGVDHLLIDKMDTAQALARAAAG